MNTKKGLLIRYGLRHTGYQLLEPLPRLISVRSTGSCTSTGRNRDDGSASQP